MVWMENVLSLRHLWYFCVQSQVSFKDKASFQNVLVSGNILFVTSPMFQSRLPVRWFTRQSHLGIPTVLQFLIVPLPMMDIALPSQTAFNALLTNKPYSQISGDFNPIHAVGSWISHISGVY
jgi:fatty acid synthase subunit alpha, fungi type